ncbi:MAG: transposase [Okeania sp. SIO2C2]|uniref:NF041680 family putative transposase n=1 Tax=Okeania sp. SIO2C2 TaxID=2607787 RepID=UPI0013BBB757|nr:NF041680 family putative transposase [Okeania sp. SIO2C2]NEP91429.1 transposase [Okeania sp. SIO2C2]
MENQENSQSIKEFLCWRENLYHGVNARKETVIELVDALSSNSIASSVVELSEHPLFRRDYNSLYKGIQEFLPDKNDDNYSQQVNYLLEAVSQTIPTPVSRHFHLFGIDTTPCPRPFSATLADKTFIHYPNPIQGNKPISIGHSYSVICALPEGIATGNVPWAVPLLAERVPSSEKATNIGNKQLEKIFNTGSFCGDKLSVLVADSFYSQRDFIGEQVKQNNLVTVTRIRSNRVFYRQFISKKKQKITSGHPRWYGDKFDLKDENTWHKPTGISQSIFTTKKGRQLTVTISGWKQMLMKGTQNYKMNRHPFTLIRITITDEVGNRIWKPMWLIAIGPRREELSLIDCYESYRQRYDMEHLFRFGKQKLLMTAYSTPDVQHEENWFKLTLIAYVNLWTARNLAVVLPHHWEQYLKNKKSVKITPSLVQRDFYRIISTLGTMATSPKRRGYSSGRIKGYKKTPRTRHQVITKGNKNSRK